MWILKICCTHIEIQNSKTSVKLLRVVENSFSYMLKKDENHSVTVGYFCDPSDNPFSFSNGFFVTFHTSYLQQSKTYTVIGISTDGRIESKAMKIA